MGLKPPKPPTPRVPPRGPNDPDNPRTPPRTPTPTPPPGPRVDPTTGVRLLPDGTPMTPLPFGPEFAGLDKADFMGPHAIFDSKQDYITEFLGPTLANPILKKFIEKHGPEGQKYLYEWWRDHPGEPLDQYDLEYNIPGGSKTLGFGGGGGGGGGGTSKAEQIANMEAEVRNQMASLGYNVVDAEVKSVAAQAVAENWTSAKLTDVLIGDTSKLVNDGSYSSMAKQLKDMAMGQLVTVDDTTAQGWARRVLSGEMDIGTIQTILQQNALNEFGWAADALTTGATMRDILAPARDTIARELELNPADIDLMNSKWRDMVQVTNTDGTKRAATLTEAVRLARKDAAYASTAGGARLAAQTGMILRKVFEG